MAGFFLMRFSEPDSSGQRYTSTWNNWSLYLRERTNSSIFRVARAFSIGGTRKCSGLRVSIFLRWLFAFQQVQMCSIIEKKKNISNKNNWIHNNDGRDFCESNYLINILLYVAVFILKTNSICTKVNFQVNNFTYVDWVWNPVLTRKNSKLLFYRYLHKWSRFTGKTWTVLIWRIKE